MCVVDLHRYDIHYIIHADFYTFLNLLGHGFWILLIITGGINIKGPVQTGWHQWWAWLFINITYGKLIANGLRHPKIKHSIRPQKSCPWTLEAASIESFESIQETGGRVKWDYVRKVEGEYFRWDVSYVGNIQTKQKTQCGGTFSALCLCANRKAVWRNESLMSI